MYKSINNYLEYKARMFLGEEFSSYLERSNDKNKANMLTNEDYLIFNKNEQLSHGDTISNKLNVLLGIKLPNDEMMIPNETMIDSSNSNYELLMDRVYESLFINQFFNVTTDNTCIKIKIPIINLDINLYPLFIKEANQNFYLSKGNGTWNSLPNTFVVIRVPKVSNINVLKVISIIEYYLKEQKLTINNSYLVYLAFSYLIDNTDIDLKTSLFKVLKKLRKSYNDEEHLIVNNKLHDFEIALDDAIRLDKTNPIDGVKLLETFIK